jgi:hypothetical protein
MLRHYLEEISALEFSERDAGIQKAIVAEKSAMNARNLLHSSMTLQALADFFAAEFVVRCDFLKDFVVSHRSLCKEQDAMTTAKAIFQGSSFQQRDRLKAAYVEAARPIRESLRSDLPRQVEEGLVAAIEYRIKKNNLYVEVAYQTMAASASAENPIAMLKPNFHGIGIDIGELWKRYIRGQCQ